MKGGWTYIVTNKRNGTLYIGVTNDMDRRIWEHKNKVLDGFTKKYGLDKLVWMERFEEIEDAIACEKRMKEWQRKWKLRAIEERNPDWSDLAGIELELDPGLRRGDERG